MMTQSLFLVFLLPAALAVTPEEKAASASLGRRLDQRLLDAAKYDIDQCKKECEDGRDQCKDGCSSVQPESDSFIDRKSCSAKCINTHFHCKYDCWCPDSQECQDKCYGEVLDVCIREKEENLQQQPGLIDVAKKDDCYKPTKNAMRKCLKACCGGADDSASEAASSDAAENDEEAIVDPGSDGDGGEENTIGEDAAEGIYESASATKLEEQFQKKMEIALYNDDGES